MRRIFGLPKEDRAHAARYLAAQGFDSIVVGADETADSIRPALDAGLRVWSCRAAFSTRGLPEPDAAALLARDLDGTPQPWFGSGCPNQPALRDAHLHHIRTVAESGAFAGFMLDGIRFASPNAGAGFFTCFCPVCHDRAAAHGIDLPAAHEAVRALRAWSRSAPAPLTPERRHLAASLLERWPGIADWLRLRAACITEHVAEVRAAVDELNVRGLDFKLGAYLFAPSLAPLVGQDYPALAPLLDVVSPMLYRTLTPGDACLATECAALVALELLPSAPEHTAADVAEEVRAARAALSGAAALVPILQLADEQVAGVSAAARDAGADDLDYFVYRPGTERYVEQVVDAR